MRSIETIREELAEAESAYWKIFKARQQADKSQRPSAAELKAALARLDALRQEIKAHPDHEKPKAPDYDRGESPWGLDYAAWAYKYLD